jgi:hypothetical protein
MKDELEGKIAITDCLVKQARALKHSPRPHEANAAAEWETRLSEELRQLKEEGQASSR